MAILRKSELKTLSEEQVNVKLVELHKDLLKVNAQRATNTPPENPGRVKEIRRTIARLYTILSQKKKPMKEVTKEKKETVNLEKKKENKTKKEAKSTKT